MTRSLKTGLLFILCVTVTVALWLAFQPQPPQRFKAAAAVTESTDDNEADPVSDGGVLGDHGNPRAMPIPAR